MLLVFLSFVRPASATSPYPATASTELVGSDPGGTFGAALAVLGDTDGDGYDELAVGVPEGNGLTGDVLVYAGSSTGIGASSPLEIDGFSMGQYLGTAVAGGDVDGDGYADLVAGSLVSGGAGEIDVYPGSATGLSTSYTTNLSGPSASSSFGTALDVGDVNGDGYADLVAGASGANVFKGQAWLYPGSAAGLDSTAAVELDRPSGGSTGWGYAVAFAGDVNGDGYGDLAVCLPGVASSPGTLGVFFGSATGVGSSASQSLSVPASGSGNSCDHLHRAGDVNGDGYDDLLVGSTGANSYGGQVLVYHGGSTGLDSSPTTQLDGSGTFLGLGTALASGDVDGDGYADVVAGGPYTGAGLPGEVHAWPGGAAGVSTTESFAYTGATADDGFGGALALGDLNHDGGLDLVIGASTAATRAGLVDVFLDTTTAEDADGDGWTSLEDCNDADPAVNPDATEAVGDLQDGDCDGFEDCGTDEDADGFRPLGDGLHASTDVTCSQPGETLGDAPTTDCDDTNSSIYPGAYELADDGIDQDCDGADAVTVDTGDGGGDTAVDTSGDSGDSGDSDDSGDADSGGDSGSAGDSGGDPTGTTDSDTGKADDAGCACAAAPDPRGLWGTLGLAGLMLVRRRRARR